MRRMRRLTQLEIQWVDCLVSDLCAENCIDPRDPEYRSAAWEAFEELHQSHRQPWNGALFWPRAVSRMNRAIQREKRVRSLYLYQMLSMDAPLGEQGATLRDFLPVQGDFTNGTAFRDFLFRLPRDLHDLARCPLDRESLEEARSSLGWSQMRMCGAVEQLREHLEAYEKI